MKLNKRDAAVLCGIPPSCLEYHIRYCSAPRPDVKIGKRYFYSEEQQEELRAYVNRWKSLLTAKDAASELGIAIETLTIRFPPTRQLGQRKFYSAADLQDIREALTQGFTRRNPQQELEALGLYNVQAAARYLGMPVITLQFWRQSGKIVRENVRHNFKPYYTREYLDHVKVLMADYFAERLP